MSLAVARIAGQVVPGVEVARAWSAALARNGGGPARIVRLASAPGPGEGSRERGALKRLEAVRGETVAVAGSRTGS
jgi:hypothetical protein